MGIAGVRPPAVRVALLTISRRERGGAWGETAIDSMSDKLNGNAVIPGMGTPVRNERGEERRASDRIVNAAEG